MNLGIDLTGLFWRYKTGVENCYYALLQELVRLEPTLDETIRFVLIDRTVEQRHELGVTLNPRFEFRRATPLPFLPSFGRDTNGHTPLGIRAWNKGVRTARRTLADRVDSISPLYRDLDVLQVWNWDLYRAPRARHIITVPDVIPLLFPQWCYHDLIARTRASLEFAKDEADAVIAISQATRQDLITIVGVEPQRIRVVYPGVREIFQPLTDRTRWRQALARYGISDAPYILSAGYLNPRKNLQGHLKAFELLANESPFRDLQLVLVGPGGYALQEFMRDLNATQFRGRVHITGYIPDDDLVLLMGGASAYVHCSLYEGFGMPVLEAMACGVPVVTSNSSSLREIAQGAALLVNPTEVNEIAAALAQALSDQPLRDQLCQRGFERTRQFSWKAWAQAHVDAYLNRSKRENSPTLKPYA